MSQRKEFLLKEGNIKKNGDVFHTTTSRFLLPVVGVQMRDFGPNFLNAYITLSDEPEIYVVCNNNEEDESLITAIIRAKINPNYIDTEIVEDEIIIKFKINKEDFNTYKLFIDGKYSKFPEHYKQRLIRIYGDKRVTRNRYVTEMDVLYPLDSKRKQIAEWIEEDIKKIDEVLDRPDISYEVYVSLTDLKSKVLNGS